MKAWMSGNVAGTGTFRCTVCEYPVSLDAVDELPTCPNCGGTEFVRASLFTTTQAAVIDMPTNTVTATHPLALSVSDLAVSDDGRYVYASRNGVRGADVVVLGLPRGGVPVAYEVARALHAPFDIFLVRKLVAPGQEELAMGAIGEGGARVENEDVIGSSALAAADIDAVERYERAELERRALRYRGDDIQPVPCVVAELDRQSGEGDHARPPQRRGDRISARGDAG